MIKKQSLWFLTLFSLILVLSVYYITMPNDLLLTNNQNYTDKEEKTNEKVTIEEAEILTALRVEAEDNRMSKIEELNVVLTDKKTTTDEENNAYEQIRYLNLLRGKEELLENKIKEHYKKNTFIKIEDNQVRVVIASNTHNYELANNIMRSIQEEFDGKQYISVKFQG
ncbi:MAG: SpoIIIAH-like family protein [Bacilli bacterium]